MFCFIKTVRIRCLLWLFVCTTAGGPLLTSVSLAQQSDSAVIFAYHRFGETGYPSTNTTVAQFKDQLETLAQENATVLSLPDLIRLYETNKPVPHKSVVLTVDDAFRSVYETAWPMIRDAGYTFTLFVSTDRVDQASQSQKATAYMTWDMIRDLHQQGVTIANHTASHTHMVFRDSAYNRAQIEDSQQRFQEELGITPRLFAYPFGEYSLEVRQMVKDFGFQAAFGQHSGVSYADGDRFTIPRFALNETYGDIKSFTLRLNALPLPMVDIIPLDPLIDPSNNPPAIGFSVGDRVSSPQKMSCYRGGRLDIQWLGTKRAEIRLGSALTKGRTRLNCTVLDETGRWRWNSLMLLLPRG